MTDTQYLHANGVRIAYSVTGAVADHLAKSGRPVPPAR